MGSLHRSLPAPDLHRPHPLRAISPIPLAPISRCSYGLVRVRENAESIAFYGGEDNEQRLLNARLRAAVDNFLGAHGRDVGDGRGRADARPTMLKQVSI